MKRIAFVCLCLFVLNTSAFAQDSHSVRVEKAYAYATSAVQKNGAVFMSVFNDADFAVSLTGAKTHVSETVELHTHVMDGDVMMMREVESYPLEGKSSLILEPMGNHIMLMGLNAPLVEGESFELKLYFNETHEHDVIVEIIKPGDSR